MNKKNIDELINILKVSYPDAKCSLNFSNAFEMLVSVCLSAQCTDERVNITTPALFNKCTCIEDYANLDLNELEDFIRPCGFFKNKAKNIKKCANIILDKYNRSSS